LNAIVVQLLGFGKPDVSNRSVQELLPLAERSVALVQDKATARNVQLDVVGVKGAQASADGLQIEQVLTNLLLNAIEASPESGKVFVRITDSDETVDVAVSDGGHGIPDDIRDHVFDAFFTTRPEGTGLGLSVSRELVAAHGGTLTFTTSPGGTTFLIRLPAVRKNQ
jgi:signal transduction histidine kinase